jgi:hypothetical protein
MIAYDLRGSGAASSAPAIATTTQLGDDLDCLLGKLDAGHGTFHARTSSFAITGAPETRMVVDVPVAAEDFALLERLRQVRRLTP